MQTDDFLIVIAFAFYTALIAQANKIAWYNEDAMLDPVVSQPDPSPYISDPTQARLENFVELSKIIITVEQCLIGTIWMVKACLLTLYYRITDGVRVQAFLVKGIIVYCILSFIVMECLFFGHWCQPFSQYWDYFTTNINCTAMTDHLITYAVFNISSDLAMMCIVLPMLLTSQLPTKTKVALCGAFGLGAFVIFCAAASKYYSFTNTMGILWVNWYLREASTAIMVANLPFLAPLVRRTIAAIKARDPRILVASQADLTRSYNLERRDTFASNKSTATAPRDGDPRVMTAVDTQLEKMRNPFEDAGDLEDAQFKNEYNYREAWDVSPWMEARGKAPVYHERSLSAGTGSSDAGTSSKALSPHLPRYGDDEE